MNEAADAAVGVRSARAARRVRGRGRTEKCEEGSRRDCLSVLDGGDDGAQLKRRELAACAQLGAGVAADLADDIGGSRKDDDSSLRSADAKARKCLDIVDACQRSLDVWDCTSFDLRDDASALKLLQRVADRTFGEKEPSEQSVAKIEKLSKLLGAPPGWTSCRVALQAAVDDTRVAESLKQADHSIERSK